MKVLVIGAGKGIGYEAVLKFLENTDNEVIAVSRNTEKLRLINSDNNRLSVVKCDISSGQDMEKLMNHLKEVRFWPDRLLITAGILIKKDYSELTKEDFISCFGVNFYAVFDTVRKVGEIMNKENSPHIVTIGSMGGVTGTLKFPGMVFYSSSKAALGCMTECMAEELKDKGININCLALGAVETEMKNAAFPDYVAPHSANEMADFVVYFTMNSGRFFNGKVLPVSVSVP